jgi:hypothetical protein
VKAAPGKYMARFRFEKDSADIPFVIRSNPGYRRTDADYDAQVSFLLQLRDKFSEVQKAIKNIRSLRSQINDFTSRMDTAKHKEIKVTADSIVKNMTLVEEALYQTKSKSGQDVLNFPIRLNDKLAGLYNVGASGENAPSRQLKETFADLIAQSDVQLNKLKKILSADIPDLNKRIMEAQLPVIGIKPE